MISDRLQCRLLTAPCHLQDESLKMKSLFRRRFYVSMQCLLMPQICSPLNRRQAEQNMLKAAEALCQHSLESGNSEGIQGLSSDHKILLLSYLCLPLDYILG